MSDVVDFRGGDFRGPVTGKAEYRQQAPAPTALDALPPPAAGFTGRDEELGRLRAALDPSGPGGEQAVLVTAVSGLGGIGKTALAVQAAYAAREAGWFPGGVLFVDLHGYDDAPVTADQALQSLLRALGVGPEHAWLDRERAGLVAAVHWAREGKHVDTAMRLAPCLSGYLRWRRHFDDAIGVGSAAQKAAHAIGNRRCEAMAWNNLGVALHGSGRVDEAIAAHVRSRDLLRDLGDRQGEAEAWHNFGNALAAKGQIEQAMEAYDP
ncbi:tetratricopeptide repeat protein [Streptomyces olivaceoviridis]|uniref:tetratricopeptide repeat protein n=1 Tax=Streptomyces olivaceoviridis TaxID=1921 RepID=UPI003691C7A8